MFQSPDQPSVCAETCRSLRFNFSSYITPTLIYRSSLYPVMLRLVGTWCILICTYSVSIILAFLDDDSVPPDAVPVMTGVPPCTLTISNSLSESSSSSSPSHSPKTTCWRHLDVRPVCGFLDWFGGFWTSLTWNDTLLVFSWVFHTTSSFHPVSPLHTSYSPSLVLGRR